MARHRGQRTGNLSEKSGSWLLRWYEDSKNIAGMRVRHWQSMVIAKATGPDKVIRRQAERIARDRVLSKLDAQVMRPAALITVQQFVTLRFIPAPVEMSLKAGAKAHYEYCLGHIMPVFGAEKLRGRKPDDDSGFSQREAEEAFPTDRPASQECTLGHLPPRETL